MEGRRLQEERRLRIFYTIPDNALTNAPTYIALSSSPVIVTVHSVASGSQNLVELSPSYADVNVKTCIESICESSPEHFVNGSPDYSVYVLDPLHSSTDDNSNDLIPVDLGFLSNIRTQLERRDITGTFTDLKTGETVVEIRFSLKPILRADASSRTKTHCKKPSDHRVELLQKSLSDPFIGESTKALLEYLTKCQTELKKGNVYAKFASISNSSGTGKTRSILQLREHGVAVVYINLRPDTDYDNVPPRDDAMAALFEGQTSTAESFYESCIRIFTALFKRLETEFTRRIQACNSESHGRLPREDYVKMVCGWNQEFTMDMSVGNQKRKDFFDSVKALYNELETSQLSSVLSLTNAYKALRELLGRFASDGDSPMLVIALDEVSKLTEWRGGGPNRWLPSHILGQVIKLYSDSDNVKPAIWVLFLSTNVKVTHFTAPAPIYPSQRIMNGELLFPPFSSLQWDIFAKPMAELDIFCVGSYNDAISFGRPLWHSVVSVYPTPELMSSFAIMKLTYTKDLTSEITEHARLAVLSQRFALRVLFGHKDAVSFIDNSIASYMRVLLSTTEDRLWQESAYPTEPVFSNAAAQLMYQQVNSLQLFLSCLNTKILSGLIDAGVLGELISRLLILISRDWAAIITHCIEVDGPKPDLLPSAYRSPPFPSSSDHQYFPYLKPVHLLDVLNILFGYQWSPGHPQAEEIKSTFARAYISASHWLTMTRDVGLLPVKTTAEEWLKSLFLRGVAIQCRHDQPLIDKVIPILFLNESGQYDGMSCCLIQDKNRSRTIPLALRMIDIGDKSIGLKTVKPYVAICFNFGAKAQPVSFSLLTKGEQKSLRVLSRGLTQELMPVLGARDGLAGQIIALRQASEKITQPDPDNTIQNRVRASILYASELSEEHIFVRSSRKRTGKEGKRDATKRAKIE